uniref:RXYLT1 C-terminal domain-containing protein n=1 Tax=Entomoneis paludosa TaxID=265537 RepID=A0A7S2YJN5_9STRA|mmetsp:Transcript_35535/g.73986  ORF Transcript_35535/g.73986 Transcript_35535/m.73986 type:complete len:450 (+) Transcript_35535:426-1775(+)|eukprot:CAMPEP_0172473544 /NCGR_PEP_ID=MMETSP1065-20121228/68908_1 /TAXON_ID=265537 /ORGANISM="Amphiprora paludosa, Strain CCMP125" /LENGTH=449 /DNA_ID=CAMNT_0013231719 /DNA_START=537 /DNA_END=1886 /DNA_ORIENTATION=-
MTQPQPRLSLRLLLPPGTTGRRLLLLAVAVVVTLVQFREYGTAHLFLPKASSRSPTIPISISTNKKTNNSTDDMEESAATSSAETSSTPQKATAATATVNVVLDRFFPEYAYSIFMTDSISRFGSGRIQYNIYRTAMRRLEPIRLLENKNTTLNLTSSGHPCILVSPYAKAAHKYRSQRAPTCHFMTSNDEYCGRKGAQIRQYHYAGSQQIYLPLGPRFDTWNGLKKLFLIDNDGYDDNATAAAVPKTSQRELVYNAVFSESTSESRKMLSSVLSRESNETRTTTANQTTTTTPSSGKLVPYKAHVQISTQWTKKLSNEHVSAVDYAQLLGNSMFTLSPTGHNPECFRIFEALEAGSIPVLALDDEYEQHKCRQSLGLYRDAPMVWLKSWNEWPETLEKLMEDRSALDDRQEALQRWYQAFMRDAVQKFEDFLFPPPAPKAGNATTMVR